MAATALDAIMRRQHPEDVDNAKRQHDAEAEEELQKFEAARDAGQEPLGPLPKKRKFVPPPKRDILAGGGSLAAVGRELIVGLDHR